MKCNIEISITQTTIDKFTIIDFVLLIIHYTHYNKIKDSTVSI